MEARPPFVGVVDYNDVIKSFAALMMLFKTAIFVPSQVNVHTLNYETLEESLTSEPSVSD